MTSDSASDAGRPGADPRSAALSRYLRQAADTFSMSADVTDSEHTAELGLALLDAAQIAQAMPGTDPRIRVLSEAGLFESMPNGQATFVEVPEIHRSLRRPLVSGAQCGSVIIAQLVATAQGLAVSGAAQPGLPRAPGQAPRQQPRSVLPLGALLEAVGTARAGLQARRAGQPSPERERKRRELVAALQAYVHALEAWPLPVPQALRTELRLHQGLLRGRC